LNFLSPVSGAGKPDCGGVSKTGSLAQVLSYVRRGFANNSPLSDTLNRGSATTVLQAALSPGGIGDRAARLPVVGGRWDRSALLRVRPRGEAREEGSSQQGATKIDVKHAFSLRNHQLMSLRLELAPR